MSFLAKVFFLRPDSGTSRSSNPSQLSATSLTVDQDSSCSGPVLRLRRSDTRTRKTTSDARDLVLGSCERLQERSTQAIAVLEALAPEKCASLEHVARICAQFFQRSSSNVEGRNGFLALRHHSHHHLCPRKLRALTGHTQLYDSQTQRRLDPGSAFLRAVARRYIPVFTADAAAT